MAVHGTGTNNRGNVLSVTSTATAVFRRSTHGNVDVGRDVVVVVPPSAAQTVYFGFGDDVTTANGFPVEAGGHFEASLLYLDEIWAIVASGTEPVRWLAMNYGEE